LGSARALARGLEFTLTPLTTPARVGTVAQAHPVVGRQGHGWTLVSVQSVCVFALVFSVGLLDGMYEWVFPAVVWQKAKQTGVECEAELRTKESSVEMILRVRDNGNGGRGRIVALRRHYRCETTRTKRRQQRRYGDVTMVMTMAMTMTMTVTNSPPRTMTTVTTTTVGDSEPDRKPSAAQR
jgi:hypothetical protein